MVKSSTKNIKNLTLKIFRGILLYVSDLLKYVFNFSSKLLIIPLIVWALFIGLGLLTGISYDLLPEELQQRLNTVIISYFEKPPLVYAVQNVIIGNYPAVMILIFLNNMFSSLLLVVYSLTIILPFLNIYLTGGLTGIVYGLPLGSGIFFSPVQTLGIITFLTLEVLAYSLAIAFGLKLVFSFLFPKKVYKKNIKRMRSLKLTLKGFKKVFLAIAILLFIAAVVETLTIISMASTITPHKIVFEECGITFEGIIPNSPAEKSNLKPFTRITKVNNEPVYNISDFLRIMKEYKPGETVIFESGNGQKFYIKLEPPREENKNVFIGLLKIHTALVKKGKCLI